MDAEGIEAMFKEERKRYRKGMAGAGLALLLAGCQGMGGWQAEDPLRTEPVVASLEEPNCAGDRCATVEADYLRFPDAPALSRTLEQRLFSLASGLGEDPDVSRAEDLQAFADEIFAASRQGRRDVPGLPGYQADLRAKVVSSQDAVVVVELDGYLFSGGAHGLPLTRYLVIDRETQQPLTLETMLLPGQRPAYVAALQRAHRRWLRSAQASGLSRTQWPFVVSDNAAPLDSGLSVSYQVYDLAPYALGQPELTIPYEELDGVLKPRYLP